MIFRLILSLLPNPRSVIVVKGIIKLNLMSRFSLLLLALGLIAFSACDKDKTDPNKPVALQKQRAAIFKQTGTWCGACPSAAATFETLVATYGDDFIGIANHGANGDPMEVSSLFSSFRSDRNSSGFPGMFINGLINQSSASTEVADWLAKPCKAGIDVMHSINGDTMLVDVQVKFFEAMTGQYYLSVFVLENGIPGGPEAGAYAQTSGGAGYTHDHVFRAGANTWDYYGEMISSNPALESTVDKSYKIPMDPSWVKANCYVAAVIWSFDGSTTPRFSYVNAIQKGAH
jgi:thiol-disulfide isomerase/thioredoxin